ncbi:metallophosphoesterase family protein [Ornithinicoccus hortensis]|uniref:Calcineurin-like phosphoesterase family protein n=1 Tax=Ornithinicoccus hortensis TaxID=82346 RepID=A0A542YM28_9MICO|nr:metallophosphoesterase [Ornithinicoccus hortensis]TQL49137.1 calcineurin-like phosphoesterase family protein [Ornithinicoccus hortensis]
MSDVETPVAEPTTRPRERRALGRALRYTVTVLVLALVGYVGGLATTSLWPITLQTQHFEASVRISPSWSNNSTVHLPTVFGDIDLEFHGPTPAPGIEGRVQVREEITELFTSGAVDIDELTPDQEELRTVMRDGLTELGWKFVGGVLGTNLLLVGLWFLGRPRKDSHSWWRPAEAVAAAVIVATLVPGIGALMTYRTSTYAAFTTTSLLSTVRGGSGMFTDIRGQAQQATPYVQNLLALSDALHQEFVNPDAFRPAAARFLLVSDIHGMNYYPLMERIIEDEDITAVIDTGDLVNFGRPREGEMAGLFSAIEDLGVPYIFVRGNHDATSPTDEAVLARMAEIPNVILLEPTAGTFVEAQVNGIRMSGFNDWRHFAEVNDDFKEQAREAGEAFAEGTRGWPLPDILVSHQPFALEDLPSAGIKVNGHMHTAALKGNQITMGSFTGGGLVNHFQVPQDEDPETAGELVGVPYAFDIVSFGEDCSLQTLTRYVYRNLVSGRPQFDNVSVLNGEQVATQPDPDGEPRTCGPDQPLQTEVIVPTDDPDGDDGADDGDGGAP